MELYPLIKKHRLVCNLIPESAGWGWVRPLEICSPAGAVEIFLNSSWLFLSSASNVALGCRCSGVSG